MNVERKQWWRHCVVIRRWCPSNSLPRSDGGLRERLFDAVRPPRNWKPSKLQHSRRRLLLRLRLFFESHESFLWEERRQRSGADGWKTGTSEPVPTFHETFRRKEQKTSFISEEETRRRGAAGLQEDHEQLRQDPAKATNGKRWEIIISIPNRFKT